MTVTKKGMMIEISCGDDNALPKINNATLVLRKPHKERVQKAMIMKLKEMEANPVWQKFIQSQCGNIPNMKEGSL